MKYVDAVAVTDACGQPGVAAGLGLPPPMPVWVLPPRGGEATAAAIGLAEDAAVVPVPAPGVDHGATEHLLGGTVFFQKLSSGSFPYVAAFQGDGYAVAAVCGVGAGTPLDGIDAALLKGRTVVGPGGGAEDDAKPPYPNLEVADEPGTMRVVDAAGAAVDCRRDDTVFVPAADRVVYVLAGGSAEDLMSILRVAVANRLPVVDVGVVKTSSGVTVRVRNLTGEDLRGVVKVLLPDGKAIGEKEFGAVSSQKVLEVPMEVSGEVEVGRGVVVEVKTSGVRGVVQRTGVSVEGK